jgi:hypothetical protein
VMDVVSVVLQVQSMYEYDTMLFYIFKLMLRILVMIICDCYFLCPIIRLLPKRILIWDKGNSN